MLYFSMDILERFTSKYEVDAQNCWTWKASKLKAGYGLFHDTKLVTAHRWSYKYYKGKIPFGLVIDHLCKNTSCVNPEHLEAVTQQINYLRGNALSNPRTHCQNGHEYTEANTLRVTGQRGRICRTCKSKSNIAYKRRKRSKAKEK